MVITYNEHMAIIINTIGLLGGNSQNLLRKFVIFFVTLSCFYKVVIHWK